MHRLNEETRNKILKMLDYTPSERAIIDQVREIPIVHGQPGAVKIDPPRYSTAQGISEQLDDFTMRIGLLYVFEFDWPNKSFGLTRMGVECNRTT